MNPAFKFKNSKYTDDVFIEKNQLLKIIESKRKINETVEMFNYLLI